MFSTTYIQSQNGFAEHIKKIIKDKNKTIKKEAYLLADLQPEINYIIIYLYNRIFCYIFYQKIFYKRFYIFLIIRDSIVVDYKKS